MVTKGHIFPAHYNEILDAKNMGGEEFCLNCDPVSIPATDMDDCFHSLLVHENAPTQCTHSHHTIAHVGDNYSINASFNPAGIRDKL
jgi:hypothetical protein